jgi:YVTN family beta-propeller protein
MVNDETRPIEFMRTLRSLVLAVVLLPASLLGDPAEQIRWPGATPEGTLLPNGWRLTPAGDHLPTSDYLLNLVSTPDGKRIIGVHGGFNPHGLVVIDPVRWEVLQRVPLKSAWLGLAWSPDGSRLFVSGGNATSRTNATAAPILGFDYVDGRLGADPAVRLMHRLPGKEIYWSGLAHHPREPRLFAANRGTGNAPGQVVVFDTESSAIVAEVPVEVTPYDLVLDPSGETLFVSNWSSRSLSVIDTASGRVTSTIAVGYNPNDMVLGRDGRLFVACGNENSVYVVDTKLGRAVEVLRTSMHPRAPVGSTPNALALDPSQKFLFVANADNNNVAVIHVGEADESSVLGFIPTAWYPSALAVAPDGRQLFVGSSKGLGGYSDIRGPRSPLAADGSREGKGSVKSLQKGSVSRIPLRRLRRDLPRYTRQSVANSPYHDSLLAEVRPDKRMLSSIVPRRVGAGSPIRHVIYIIKENRTYDQVFGDLPQGNGDPRLTIFGREVTPNHHKLAEQFVLLDNLYCDAEVSVDGHSWSTAAYATDFNEKLWPPNYGGHSSASVAPAVVPSSGYLWDAAARKGLTYRSYGEYASRVSEGGQMDAAPGVSGLVGHVCPKFRLPGMRDTDNVRAFFAELDEYDRHFDSTNRALRLPNYIVMSLGEDHTQGTRSGAPTPVACVANNDWAVGQLVERVTRSPYWPATAIFVIEDDAQDGPDHVDARRTIGLVVSPYTRRGHVDSTLYTTSSMIRTMELLLGIPPMTQYDAAATPMTASFTDVANLEPYIHEPPRVDVQAKNLKTAWGSGESEAMDFSDYDRTPMFALNRILWKSVKGADSEMPLPVRGIHFRR